MIRAILTNGALHTAAEAASLLIFLAGLGGLLLSLPA